MANQPLSAEQTALVALSDELSGWCQRFKERFDINPMEVGLTDRLLLSLSDENWVEAVERTTRQLEAKEGHDFTLVFTYENRRCKLYLQAKVVFGNRHEIDFIDGYQNPSPEPSEKSLGGPQDPLRKKLGDLRRDLRKEERSTQPDPQVLENLEKKIQVLEELMEAIDQGKKKVKSNIPTLQPERLYRTISKKVIDNAADMSYDYVGGGYIIYGLNAIGYISISSVELAYREVVEQATSLTNLNVLINNYLWRWELVPSALDILVNDDVTSKYRVWKNRSFGGG